MRFNLVDRIDAYEPARSIRARKLTSRSEEYWDDCAGAPRMPDALVLEALCQAATWLVALTTERRKCAVLLSIAAVEFHADVPPGVTLLLEGEVESMSDEMAVISGRALVDGRAVMTASDIMCALIDTEELDDPQNTARMQRMLTRAGAG